MFGKVMSVVLGFLGISAFAKDEKGKSILLSTQEEQLKQKYGAVFVEAFKKDLAEFEKEGRNAEEAVTDEVRTELERERDSNATALAQARKSLKELDDYYSDHRSNEWEYLVEIQEGQSIDVIDHETLNFGKEINDAGYYIVYSWGSGNSLLEQLDIRGH